MTTAGHGTSDEARWFGIACYVLSGLVLAEVIAGYLAGVLPGQVSNPLWRHGASNHFGRLLTFLCVGFFIAILAARARYHSRVMRNLGVAAATLVAMVVVLVTMFVFDHYTLIEALPLEQRASFRLLDAKVLFQLTTGMIVLLMLAWTSWRMARMVSEPEVRTPG